MKIRANIDEICLYDLEGKLPDVIQFLKDTQNRYSDGEWEDLQLATRYGRHNDDRDTLQLTGLREERPVELKNRLNKEKIEAELIASHKTQQEEAERKQYEKLKKKFERKIG